MPRPDLLARIQRLLTRYRRPIPEPSRRLTLEEARPMIDRFLRRLLSLRP